MTKLRSPQSMPPPRRCAHFTCPDVVAFVVVGLLALVGATLTMGGCNERPACQPTELARIDSAFVAEAVQACRGRTIDACPEYPAIKAKYAARRDQWVSCR